jgi:hypothetical protein
MPSKPENKRLSEKRQPFLQKGEGGFRSGSEPPEGPGKKRGVLYLVATPIGNLGDITLRALETLRAVDLIAAEDTRHTRKLLSHYDIHKPLTSYHSHNAAQRGPELLGRLLQGQDVALVTDAGTPAISDPGALLVAEALELDPALLPLSLLWWFQVFPLTHLSFWVFLPHGARSGVIFSNPLPPSP